MGIARLREFLERQSVVALDSCLLIYQVEANPKYVSLTHEVFSWLQRPRSRGITSTISMTELLVQPYREDNLSQVDDFYALFSTFPNLTWIPPSLEIADLAARIRGQYGFRTPDALLAATAIQGSATGLITNDAVFRRVPGIEIAVLDDLLKGQQHT